MSMIAKYGFWGNKQYHLNKMTLNQLVAAYFQYYAIQAYLLCAAGALYVSINYATAWIPNIIAASIAFFLYPLIWYALHRWVLHSQWMYKNRWTASTWKRIHYDHHQDPHDLSILFGALYTTLPTIALVTIPVGYALDGIGGAGSALASGLIMTCFYEFAHCIQHLSYKPKNKYLIEMKQRHMAHHFHDEKGNFGITNFLWDRMFHTVYDRPDRPEKSPTVFNLGYTKDVAETYPWVADLSGGLGHENPRQRRKELGIDE